MNNVNMLTSKLEKAGYGRNDLFNAKAEAKHLIHQAKARLKLENPSISDQELNNQIRAMIEGSAN